MQGEAQGFRPGEITRLNASLFFFFFPSLPLLRYGTQTLSLSKIVPHLCSVTGDQNPQVRRASCSVPCRDVHN